MKKYKYILIPIAIIGLAGCELGDKIQNKVEEEYERIVHQYEEYTGTASDRGEKPFVVVYQESEVAKSTLISSQCSSNSAVEYLYYSTPAEVTTQESILSNIASGSLKPILDIRYVNPVTKYINDGFYDYYANHSEFTGLDVRSGVRNVGIGTSASQIDSSGSIAQSECINGSLATGVTINLSDAPEQFINYGGPQITFAYNLSSSTLTSPWKANKEGNLLLQGYFNQPIYSNLSTNIGGSASFGLFIRNKKSGEKLNFVIAIYAAGEAWIQEKAGIKFDPTTNIVHVATLVKDSSWWSTKSPKSNEIQEIFSAPDQRTTDSGIWDRFYRANISYQNLLAVLNELKVNPPIEAAGIDFGLSPEDWEVTTVMVQYELEEIGGKATFSGSFKDFEVYVSQNPL